MRTGEEQTCMESPEEQLNHGRGIPRQGNEGKWFENELKDVKGRKAQLQSVCIARRPSISLVSPGIHLLLLLGLWFISLGLTPN